MITVEDSHRYCGNQAHGVCNWLLPASSPETFCVSCSTNKTIPNLAEPGTPEKWKRIEIAKHRVFYNLLKLGLRFSYEVWGQWVPLQFEFLQSKPHEHILTGHSHGLITLNINEADPVEQTKVKQDLNEKYRSLIGHFRHELGHYYWETLVAPYPDRLAACRELFGDERSDYTTALQHYYQNGPQQYRQEDFVSVYAAAHPWEDWAETWAHYLHIMDTADTASSYGVNLDRAVKTDMRLFSEVYEIRDFSKILASAIPVFVFANSLNSGMGLPPLYPFQLTGNIEQKLNFIHTLCLEERG